MRSPAGQISGLASLPLDTICVSNRGAISVATAGRPWTLLVPWAAVFQARSSAARRTWELGSRGFLALDPSG